MPNNLTPSKALIQPTGVTTVKLSELKVFPDPISHPKMSSIVSPVTLNPKILVPRFSLVVVASNAEIASTFSFQDSPVVPGPIRTSAGYTVAATFPSVYHTKGFSRPTFGQIFPRGLNGK